MPPLVLISALPFPLLYGLSDALYLVLYRVAGYRRDVVRGNLAIAFPEKPETERRRLERAFYRHLADLFLEMLKTFTVGQKTLMRHWVIENPEVMNRFYDQGRSVVMMTGHMGNWEWSLASGGYFKHRGMAIYKKLSNPFFEQWMLRSRHKFGMDIIPTYLAFRYIETAQREGRLMAYGFAADQNPLRHKAKLWLPFFGKTVPVHTGAEEIARRYDLPVVYAEIRKLKRGHYRARLEVLCEHPSACAPDEITRRYFARLEESIRRQPEVYYWIHRRFRHARN